MTAHTKICASCSSAVTGELYHLGFSGMDCMYCDSCPKVLLLKDPAQSSSLFRDWPHLVAGDAGWEEYDRHLLPHFERLEMSFEPCTCGGRYRKRALPRCPLCNQFLVAGKVEPDKPVFWRHQHVFITAGSVDDMSAIRVVPPNTSLERTRGR